MANQHAEHLKELENARLEREKLIVEYQEKLKKQSKDFEVRLKKEKQEWRKAIQVEIDEEKDEVRQGKISKLEKKTEVSPNESIANRSKTSELYQSPPIQHKVYSCGPLIEHLTGKSTFLKIKCRRYNAKFLKAQLTGPQLSNHNCIYNFRK